MNSEGGKGSDSELELSLGGLNASDEIMIRTGNSVYSFSVTDPAGRRGVLSGGSLDGQKVEAALVGSLVEGGEKNTTFLTSLKTGARALFYVDLGGGVKRLLTSAVTDLIYLRCESLA
jgi:hypothetical protein